MQRETIIRALATCFLAGGNTPEQIVERCERMLGGAWPWLRSAARRYVEAVANRARPRHREVVQLLARDFRVVRALRKYSELQVRHWLAEAPRMQPVGAAESWAVPVIETTAALCDWLWLEPGELAWFADLRFLASRGEAEQLRHYRYLFHRKQSGGVRLIESPKPRLKALQRQVLDGMLSTIPAHPSAHGFLSGRSIRTFAAPHAGKQTVARLDIRNFFPSLTRARVQSFFRAAGYPEPVADALGGLCTNAVPQKAWAAQARDMDRDRLRELKDLYRIPHLPQGAPTSPALANLCCYRVDCRMTGLAKAFGATYTRYADDLAFSGNDDLRDLPAYAAAILRDEGLEANYRKTREMPRSTRQHLAGLVVNRSLNVARPEFDRIKAILTNCVRHGPVTQNREGHADFRAHLRGRLAFFESVNPAKAVRLRKLFDSISWNE